MTLAAPADDCGLNVLAPPLPSWRTLALGLAGSLLCYLAHPPAGLSLLAWIGPAPWLLLVRSRRLPGRRPYRALWLAGMAYWLVAIQWIRLPFWANIFGLFLLAAYLGIYLPAFVGLSRIAVHRLRVPVWLAGAIVWTGLELARAHLLSGFLMASLAHTQVKWPLVVQIADLGGEYAVTFLIMLVAGSIAAALPLNCVEPSPPSEPRRPRPGRPAITRAPPRRHRAHPSPPLRRLAPVRRSIAHDQPPPRPSHRDRPKRHALRLERFARARRRGHAAAVGALATSGARVRKADRPGRVARDHVPPAVVRARRKASSRADAVRPLRGGRKRPQSRQRGDGRRATLGN